MINEPFAYIEQITNELQMAYSKAVIEKSTTVDEALSEVMEKSREILKKYSNDSIGLKSENHGGRRPQSTYPHGIRTEVTFIGLDRKRPYAGNIFHGHSKCDGLTVHQIRLLLK